MMRITTVLAILTGFLFSVPGFAVPAPPTSPNPAALEFQGEYFLGALPTQELGSVGPTVTPNGEVLQEGNVSMGQSSNEPQQELRITIGTERQHVGFTRSRDLGGYLRKLLEKLCGLRDPSPDNDAAPPANAAAPGPMCSRANFLVMKNICYNIGCEAYVGVQVESDYITAPALGQDAKDLLKIFIDQIVKTFEATINCDKNRYVIDLSQISKHRRDGSTKQNCREFANSADWYQVGIHGMPNNIFPHMRVKIWFNGKTNEGQLDCKGTQSSAWGSLPNSRIQEFAKMFGVPLRSAVSCADKSGTMEGWPTGIDGCSWNPHAVLRCGHDPECGLQ